MAHGSSWLVWRSFFGHGSHLRSLSLWRTVRCTEVASASLNTLHTLSFSYFLGLSTLHFLMYCFLFLPKYLCLVFEISLVTCELGNSSCLTSSTSPLQSLVNVHFCFKPWCFERESDKVTPFHLRTRAVSSQETLRMSLSQALASSHTACDQHPCHRLPWLLILGKYGRRVALLVEEWLFRLRS